MTAVSIGVPTCKAVVRDVVLMEIHTGGQSRAMPRLPARAPLQEIP